MKTYSQLAAEHPKAFIPNDVFASYYHDGGDEEWLYFKLIPWNVIRYIMKGLQQMRLFPHYKLQREEEDFRNGYINERFSAQMINRDEAFVPLKDLKLITSELTTAMGYQLHWIPVEKILNLKNN